MKNLKTNILGFGMLLSLIIILLINQSSIFAYLIVLICIALIMVICLIFKNLFDN